MNRHKIYPLLMASLLLAVACAPEPSIDTAAKEIRGDGFRILHLGEARPSEFSISLDVGSEASDVYVVFTNPHSGALADVPHVTGSADGVALTSSVRTAGTTRENASVGRGSYRRGLPPELREFDAVGEALEDDDEVGPLRFSGETSYVVDETPELLYRLNGTNPTTFKQVDATVRAVIEPNGADFGLVVWVENSLWSGNGGNITADMVNALAQVMAAPVQSDRSIMQFVADIYGDPWGSHSVSNAVSEGERYVHVFLANIADAGFDPGDNDTPPEQGFVAGYFFGNDTLLDAGSSNEKLMVYLHGPAYASADNTQWDPYDFWPSEIILTAAHELQHLTNFYQRWVRSGRITQSGWNTAYRDETWLDEMMSLLAEDSVGRLSYTELGTDGDAFLGPRGVRPTEISAGEPDNEDGRLADFAIYPDRSLTTWSNNGVQYDYAASYAFGAWLVRNFGGVELMSAINTSGKTNTAAVEDAVRTVSGAYTSFGELLEQWAAATVLRGRNVPVGSYRYLGSSWFRSSAATSSILLGSINVDNYRWPNGTGETGLFTFTPSQPAGNALSGHAAHSNIYYSAASGVTDRVDLNIATGVGSRVSIIVVRSP